MRDEQRDAVPPAMRRFNVTALDYLSALGPRHDRIMMARSLPRGHPRTGSDGCVAAGRPRGDAARFTLFVVGPIDHYSLLHKSS
jgi:hypothetical protein